MSEINRISIITSNLPISEQHSFISSSAELISPNKKYREKLETTILNQVSRLNNVKKEIKSILFNLRKDNALESIGKLIRISENFNDKNISDYIINELIVKEQNYNDAQKILMLKNEIEKNKSLVEKIILPIINYYNTLKNYSAQKNPIKLIKFNKLKNEAKYFITKNKKYFDIDDANNILIGVDFAYGPLSINGYPIFFDYLVNLIHIVEHSY